MKNTIFLLLFVFGLFACEDDDSIFELSTDGLEVKFTPVAGGAMMYYKLPNNSDIFAVNVRYKNWQGQDVLKTSGYSGDSLLLDDFFCQSSQRRIGGIGLPVYDVGQCALVFL